MVLVLVHVFLSEVIRKTGLLGIAIFTSLLNYLINQPVKLVNVLGHCALYICSASLDYY